MLTFKDKKTGRSKFILRDSDVSPVSVDQAILEDDMNNSEEDDPNDESSGKQKEQQDGTVRTKN